MSLNVYLDNVFIPNIEAVNVSSLKQNIFQQYGIPDDDLCVTINGKHVPNIFDLRTCQKTIRLSTRLVGGKGGFGSMLRAIGAQIEKTTNREACRDLSGRRLRDINEEKRLRKWLDGQEDREREAAERKQKKLDKLLAEPRIEVTMNPEYEKERQELPERVSAAVDAGWQNATTSEHGLKRKIETVKNKAKKKKLWIDSELSDCSSLSEDDEECLTRPSPGQSASTDSGNESDKAEIKNI